MQLKRRKATIRLPGYDYSKDGLYFITSCVQDRRCHFGHVDDNQMILNSFGQIAQNQLIWMLQRYPYVAAHAFVVMPNHIHAVLEINRKLLVEKNALVGTGRDLSLPAQMNSDGIQNDMDGVGTGRDLSLHHPDDSSQHHPRHNEIRIDPP